MRRWDLKQGLDARHRCLNSEERIIPYIEGSALGEQVALRGVFKARSRPGGIGPELVRGD